MKMKIEHATEDVYIRTLMQALYREHCDCTDFFGATSEIVHILNQALCECMDYCDKYNIDYNLNYDNN